MFVVNSLFFIFDSIASKEGCLAATAGLQADAQKDAGMTGECSSKVAECRWTRLHWTLREFIVGLLLLLSYHYYYYGDARVAEQQQAKSF